MPTHYFCCLWAFYNTSRRKCSCCDNKHVWLISLANEPTVGRNVQIFQSALLQLNKSFNCSGKPANCACAKGNRFLRCLMHICSLISSILSCWTSCQPEKSHKPQQMSGWVLVTVPRWLAAHCSSLSGPSLGRSESTSTGARTEKRRYYNRKCDALWGYAFM